MQPFDEFFAESRGVDESTAATLTQEFEGIVKANQDIWIEEQKNTSGSGPKSWWVVRFRNDKGEVDNSRIFLFSPDNKDASYKTWQDAMKAYLTSGRHRSIAVFTGMPKEITSFIRKAQKKVQ